MSDHPSQPAHPATATAAAEPGRLPRLLALTAVSVGVLVLAAAAFLFSYPGIHAIALHAGVSASLARGYPVIFDAMLVIAFAAVLSLRGAGLVSRCYAWLSLIVLLAAVAGASAAHSARVVIPHRPAAVTAAILPWALLLIGFGLLVAMLRHARMSRAAARAAAARAPAAPGARAAAAPAAAADQVPGPRLPAGPPIAALPPAALPPSSPALETLALGTPALDSPGPGTPAPGTLALGTPAPGTPAPGTPAPGTPAPGSSAGSAAPAPGGAPLTAPPPLPPLPQIPSGVAGSARPGSGQQGPVPSAGAGQEDRAVAVPVRGRHAGGPAADGPDGTNGSAAGAAAADSEPASGQQSSGQQPGGQQPGGHQHQPGPADDGLPDPGHGASNGAEESRPGLPKRVPAATLGENGDGAGSLARRTSVRIEETPVTAPAAAQDAGRAGDSTGTGTEPGPAAPPAFHRMWSSPTPPGEETD